MQQQYVTNVSENRRCGLTSSALYTATSPEVEEKGWNGYYFNDPGQPDKETKQASDPALGAALWDLSTRIIKDKVGEDALVDWNSTAE
jgi:hypothetical protein